MKTVSAQAPAKVIIIGEHAVVYGYPAITATIDLFANCEISDNTPGRISIRIPKFDIAEDINPQEIIALKHKLDVEKDLTGLAKADMTSLIKAILITVLTDNQLDAGFTIKIDSEIPTGGFGSSSAVSAALIKALNLYFDLNLADTEQIDLLCKGESLFQGYKVSGLDQISVFNRGINEFRRTNGNLEHKHIKEAANFFGDFLVIHTGKPDNTTGEVVNYLADKNKNDDGATEKIFKSLTEIEQKILVCINTKNRAHFLDLIRNAGELLIELGIVRPATVKLHQKLNSIGGASKVTGAGAISGTGSGAILCFADDLEPISNYLTQQNIIFYKVKLV